MKLMEVLTDRSRIREIGTSIHMTGKFPDNMTQAEKTKFARIQNELRATSRDIVICHLFKIAENKNH